MDRIFSEYFCKFSKADVFWLFPDRVAAILFYAGNDISAYVLLKCLIMQSYRGWEEALPCILYLRAFSRAFLSQHLHLWPKMRNGVLNHLDSCLFALYPHLLPCVLTPHSSHLLFGSPECWHSQTEQRTITLLKRHANIRAIFPEFLCKIIINF